MELAILFVSFIVFLALGVDASPYLNLYELNQEVLTKQASPGTLPTAACVAAF